MDIDIPVEVPIATNGAAKESRVSAGGDAVDLIVRTHDACHFTFDNAFSKWNIKCVFHLLFANLSTYMFAQTVHLR